LHYNAELDLAFCHLCISSHEKKLLDLACNEAKDPSERGVALLDCIESRIAAVPSDFTKVVNIIMKEPFLESLTGALIKSYCKCGQGWKERWGSEGM
jgi:hypothetical protein